MSEIFFELVSPEKKLISEPVYMAEIPGDEGMMGILSGHCGLVSSLSAGVVRLHKTEGDKDVRKIFIAGGFADITPDNCSVLAEEAISIDDLDKDSLEQSLRDLNEDLSLLVEAADIKRTKEKIALTKAKLVAVAGYN